METLSEFSGIFINANTHIPMQNQSQNTIRLDKFLANAGILSRRGIKQFLKKETVTVNGKRVTESGIRLDPQKDIVLINGQKIKKPELVWYMLNKPMGYISTTSDEQGRQNVTELIDTHVRIYPVGRLDKDTHGLLLLTNDGELTHQLIHPKYHVPKVYRLVIQNKPNVKQIKLFQTGVMLDDGITLPSQTKIIMSNSKQTILEVTLHEGRNRQIRRMCEAVGLELLDLQRISFGPLKLGNLKLGNYRKLLNEEIQSLKMAVAKE